MESMNIVVNPEKEKRQTLEHTSLVRNIEKEDNTIEPVTLHSDNPTQESRKLHITEKSDMLEPIAQPITAKQDSEVNHLKDNELAAELPAVKQLKTKVMSNRFPKLTSKLTAVHEPETTTK